MSTRVFWSVVLATIALGIVFRVEHVQRRMLWADESWTALRISGNTYWQLRALFDNQVHPVSDILRFQEVDPSHSVGATVTGLATEEPQHAPLFYVVDRVWAGFAGSAIQNLRTPALMFSLLAIAAAAWLCFELSGKALVAGTGAALMALSPFFVDYGGQAREYGLWATMIGISSALLLRALRLQSFYAWVWYGAAILLAVYSDLFMLIVVIAQALWIFIFQRSNRTTLVAYSLATVSALILFAPWMLVVFRGSGVILNEEVWTRAEYPLRQFVEKWAFNTATVLFDGEYATTRLLVVGAAALLILGYAAYRLFRDERRAVAWFVALPALAIAVPQILYDLIAHGHESTESRYLVPLWLALLVTLALFLGRRIESASHGISTPWFGVLAAVLVAACGSDAINSAARVWWDNDDNYPSTTMAQAINASTSPPLVVSEGHWAEVLVMSHYVSSDTRFLLFKFSPPTRLPLARNTFLLAPSEGTLSALKARAGIAVAPVPVAPLLSAPLLDFRRAMLVTKERTTYAMSFGGFLYRLSPQAKT